MRDYWNGVWDNPDINEYIKYTTGYATAKPAFLETFAQYGVKNVCDAACGFGAYSVMLAKNGYNVSGFDISCNAIRLAQKMLVEFDCPIGGYKVCEITKIDYEDKTFDAVVAHAVIDHLSLAGTGIALNEMRRILTPGGLLYLTFDPLSEDDVNKQHMLLEDGSRQYEDGLLFRHYSDGDIQQLLQDTKVIFSNTNSRGVREFVLRTRQED